MNKQYATGGTGGPGGIGKDAKNLLSEDLLVMNIKVLALSPLHTGENKEFSRSQRKVDNKIPTRMSGDGIRKDNAVAVMNFVGPLRAYAEKIYKDRGACDVGIDPGGCRKASTPCIICDLFGYLGKKGRITVDELRSVEPFHKVVQLTTHPRIDRDTGTVCMSTGATLLVEEIVEGTVLTTKILIRNPKDTDIQILRSAFDAMQDSGIGGWTKRGRGRVIITETIEKKKWSDYRTAGEEKAKKLLSGIK